ncbi:MAG: TonB family protein [bacterium]
MNDGSSTDQDRPLALRWKLLIGLAISLLVNVLAVWPLFGRLVTGNGKAPEIVRPRELVVELHPAKPAPEEQRVPERQPRSLARTLDPKQHKLLAQRTRPRVRPDRLQRPRRLLRRQPKPRPRPKPKRPKPKAKQKRQKIEPLKMRLKMVDQDYQKNEQPPKDARFLAAKNRDVKRETRARHVNLDRHSNKTQLSPKPKQRIGSLTRQTKTETRLPQRAVQERAGAARQGPRPRPKVVAQERPQPAQEARRQSLLTMRDRRVNQDKDVLNPDKLPRSKEGLRVARPDRRRQRMTAMGRTPITARRRLKLRLTPQDADRIYGKQWAQQWKQRHARRGARGPKSQRWAKIKAALANYIPEVKEGNQTALKTRAHPFARYIAFMHRKIHPRWGDGFLVDLDRLPAADGFNDYTRWTKLEIVLNRQGQVVKVGIVKPSGYLPFDVAALDVVFSAGPFGAPPQAIVSPNGNVYMHWEFWRNHRQCGTFGVNPFILAAPKTGPSDRGAGSAAAGKQRLGRALRRRGPAVRQRVAAASRRAARQPDGDLDARARGPAVAWLMGLMQGQVGKMLAVSKVPFTASGKVVARTKPRLQRVLQALIDENPKLRLQTEVQLLTASGLRSRLGTLPRGVRPGTPDLFVVARLGQADVVLILGRAAGARWQVVGLAR